MPQQARGKLLPGHAEKIQWLSDAELLKKDSDFSRFKLMDIPTIRINLPIDFSFRLHRRCQRLRGLQLLLQWRRTARGALANAFP